MNSKKIMLTVIFTVALLTIAVWFLTSAIFFKEISPVSPESKDIPETKEGLELTYPIPSNAITTGQTIEDTITRAMEKQRALKERELEAENTRKANRAEAFARQKTAEKALLSTTPIEDSKQTAVVLPPQEEDKLPTDEEIKKMESKGILSY